MKRLFTFFTGKRVQGEPAFVQTNFKTVVPQSRPDFSEWVKEVNFGRQFGLNLDWRDQVRKANAKLTSQSKEPIFNL